MGSGVNSSGQGKYVGNGGSEDQEIKPGFKPKVLKIRSDEGEVVLHKTMSGAWFQTNSAAPTFLAASALELTEFGFKVSGNVVGVNTDAKEYFYEAY